MKLTGDQKKMVSIDTFLKIGKQHSICEDYIISGEKPILYTLLADGCSSSGMLKNSYPDLGARFLCHSTKLLLQTFPSLEYEIPRYDTVADFVINHSITLSSLLGINKTSLDATLLLAFIFNNSIHIYTFGDGNIISLNRDNVATLYKISYGKNAPDYLSYRLNAKRKRVYEKLEHNERRVQRIAYKGIQVESKDLDPEVCIFTFPLAEFKCILITSDGIESFINSNMESPSTEEIVKNLIAFKNPNGSFLKRRLKRMIKNYEKIGYYNQDDISVGGFYIE